MHVRPSVCLSVHPSVRYESCETIFYKRINRFCCKLAQLVLGQRHEMANFVCQEVKSQGHMRPNLIYIWRSGRNVILDSLESIRLSTLFIRSDWLHTYRLFYSSLRQTLYLPIWCRTVVSLQLLASLNKLMASYNKCVKSFLCVEGAWQCMLPSFPTILHNISHTFNRCRSKCYNELSTLV